MARPREFDEAAVLDAAIERFWQSGYEATSVRALADKQRRGCMLVNSAIESAPHDAKFFDIVAIFLDEVERFFFRCVSNGQKDGTITRAYSAEDLSRSLLGALLGIRVLARVRPERKLLEGLLRPIFGLLDDTLSVRRRSKRAGSATS